MELLFSIGQQMTVERTLMRGDLRDFMIFIARLFVFQLLKRRAHLRFGGGVDDAEPIKVWLNKSLLEYTINNLKSALRIVFIVKTLFISET